MCSVGVGARLLIVSINCTSSTSNFVTCSFTSAKELWIRDISVELSRSLSSVDCSSVGLHCVYSHCVWTGIAVFFYSFFLSFQVLFSFFRFPCIVIVPVLCCCSCCCVVRTFIFLYLSFPSFADRTGCGVMVSDCSVPSFWVVWEKNGRFLIPPFLIWFPKTVFPWAPLYGFPKLLIYCFWIIQNGTLELLAVSHSCLCIRRV